MSDKPNRSIRPSSGGFFNELTQRGKLILRLIADKRVSPLLKVLPIGTLVYLVVPDIVLGPIDDAAIIWLGTYAFVEMCPPDIVQEHMRNLAAGKTPGEISEPGAEQPAKGDDSAIDGEFFDLSGEDARKDRPDGG